MTRSSPNRAAVAEVILVLLGVLGSAGCSSEVATQASVGDCFQDPGSLTIRGLEKVACDEAHDNEVFAVFDLDGDDFPGRTSVEELAREGCIERFEGYVGATSEASELGFFTITPTEETWEKTGDREVICAAFLLDEGDLEGSVEGTGR